MAVPLFKGNMVKCWIATLHLLTRLCYLSGHCASVRVRNKSFIWLKPCLFSYPVNTVSQSHTGMALIQTDIFICNLLLNHTYYYFGAFFSTKSSLNTSQLNS